MLFRSKISRVVPRRVVSVEVAKPDDVVWARGGCDRRACRARGRMDGGVVFPIHVQVEEVESR